MFFNSYKLAHALKTKKLEHEENKRVGFLKTFERKVLLRTNNF